MSMRIDLEHSWKGTPLSEANNFGRMLFDLIAKADAPNRERLRLSFPVHVSVWETHMLTGEFPDMSIPSGE